ncbi:hypothetical protein [Granulibacter bethesdensis]|uniref:hypothetical protein n=1 Tax=Granulibacter bethesdensis TaxID=364410 RepID=UPI000933AE2A|nr:hypothetical protein [Granulibacter bethesdensis]
MATFTPWVMTPTDMLQLAASNGPQPSGAAIKKGPFMAIKTDRKKQPSSLSAEAGGETENETMPCQQPKPPFTAWTPPCVALGASAADQAVAAQGLHTLPFVRVAGDGSGTRFWAPEPSGDYLTDCGLGAAYGQALLAMLRAEPEGPSHVLAFLLQDLLRHGDIRRDGGLLAGMATVLSDVLRQPVAQPRSSLPEEAPG